VDELTDALTYTEVGATRHEPLPAGYRHLHYRTSLGPVPFREAAEAVLTFAMHRASGERVVSSTPRAAVGTTVVSYAGLGPLRLRVPCRVVWVEESDGRAGFGYGTLPGHVARGEESFVLTRDAGGEVWFTVTAFSVPGRWLMTATGPFGPLLQAAYARIRAAALRRVLRSAPPIPRRWAGPAAG
jgi:uncharacterized protein (UPF0548 family)